MRIEDFAEEYADLLETNGEFNVITLKPGMVLYRGDRQCPKSDWRLYVSPHRGMAGAILFEICRKEAFGLLFTYEVVRPINILVMRRPEGTDMDEFDEGYFVDQYDVWKEHHGHEVDVRGRLNAMEILVPVFTEKDIRDNNDEPYDGTQEQLDYLLVNMDTVQTVSAGELGIEIHFDGSVLEEEFIRCVSVEPFYGVREWIVESYWQLANDNAVDVHPLQQRRITNSSELDDKQ